MGKEARATRNLLRSMERSSLRSSMYWWMVEHYDDMVKATKGHRIRWADFCRDARRLGLTDTRGRPPTEGNARETWRQARKTVEAERAAAAGYPSAKQRPAFPSHVAKAWRPAEAPKAGVPALTPAQGSGWPVVHVDPNKPFDRREMMAFIKHQINHRSGRE